MPLVTHEEHIAADLYWLAYLLTGRREVSLDVAVEALEQAQSANPFFSSWMAAWSRKLVIAKALQAVQEELSESALHISRKGDRFYFSAPGKWTLPAGAGKVQLERALLAIEIFPRCALALSIFEGLSIEDVSILLNAEPNLVRSAQRVGLQELVVNLAATSAAKSGRGGLSVSLTEVQHA
jgi:DNA-directed RNA polymerase specialized sigma24 family protein